MVCDISKIDDSGEEQKSPLLPDRYPTGDLFVCDVFDAALKGDMASMEHPIFSLSTKPDKRARRYEHKGIFVVVKPSHDGLATVHDRDVLIFCISQLMAAINRGERVSQTVSLKAFDLLKATNRMTNGQAYEGLKAAFQRLSGTRIETNITTGGKEQWETFGLIESARIVRESREGRMQEVEIKLSDWVFNAIEAKEVLTLHRDYFRLRKPLERRMYEIARKHCNRKAEWRISTLRLQEKCGSSSTRKEFRRMLRKIIEQDLEHNHFPDYRLHLDGDIVVFLNRNTIPRLTVIDDGYGSTRLPLLDPDTYSEARAAAPGWDVKMLESEWRRFWIKKGREPLRNPDIAFLGFCRKWSKNNRL